MKSGDAGLISGGALGQRGPTKKLKILDSRAQLQSYSLVKQIKIFRFALVLIGIVMMLSDSVKGEGVRALTCVMYVGTYTGAKSEGVYAYTMDLSNGSFTPMGLVSKTPNPTFLDLDSKHGYLYAVNEIEQFEGKPAGAVSAFSIDRTTGKLTLLNQRSSGGSGPCQITLDGKQKNVLVANYGGGSVAVLPIAKDGGLGEASIVIQHQGKSVNPERQQGPRAHCMTVDAGSRFAFACDLGMDKVVIYRLDSEKGTLAPNEPAFVPVKPGAGPRHLTFSPNGRQAYLINELDSTVVVFGYDPIHGALKELQTVSTLPTDFKATNYGAEIEVHASGKFLYASNRGHNSIAVFAIDPAKGTLTLVEHQSTQGKTPRHFSIDPTGRFLIAANQDSDSLVVFGINLESGRLKPTGQVLKVGAPVCVKFTPPGAIH